MGPTDKRLWKTHISKTFANVNTFLRLEKNKASQEPRYAPSGTPRQSAGSAVCVKPINCARRAGSGDPGDGLPVEVAGFPPLLPGGSKKKKSEKPLLSGLQQHDRSVRVCGTDKKTSWRHDPGPHHDFRGKRSVSIGEPASNRVGKTPPVRNFQEIWIHKIRFLARPKTVFPEECQTNVARISAARTFSKPKQCEKNSAENVKLPDRKNIDTGTRFCASNKCPNASQM